MQIDPEFSTFAVDPRNTVRPLPAHLSLDRVRIAANAAMMDRHPPPIANVVDAVLADTPVRIYRPSTGVLPVIVFVHGGGFVWGSLDTHDGICRRLALASGAAVISVGYRLAPEARFPAARDDVTGVVAALAGVAGALQIDSGRVALCGDSAGGHVALTSALVLRDQGKALRHLALVYPALDPGCTSESHIRCAEGPILSSAGMRWFWTAYLGEGPRQDACPLDMDLSGLPSVTVVTAGLDPLCDEGADLVRHLKRADGQVLHRHFDTAPHGFLSLDADAATSRDCLGFVARRMAEALA